MPDTLQVVARVAARGATKVVEVVAQTSARALAGAAGIALLAGALAGYGYYRYHKSQVETQAQAVTDQLAACSSGGACDKQALLNQISGLDQDTRNKIRDKVLDDPRFSG